MHVCIGEAGSCHSDVIPESLQKQLVSSVGLHKQSATAGVASNSTSFLKQAFDLFSAYTSRNPLPDVIYTKYLFQTCDQETTSHLPRILARTSVLVQQDHHALTSSHRIDKNLLVS